MMKVAYSIAMKVYSQVSNICQTCKKTFISVRRCKFCSNPCRRHAYHLRTYVPSPHMAVGKANVGAANELKVCTDLLFKGFSVFRAMSPHASCDILALKGRKIWRVEVRTGRDSKRNRPFWPHPKNDKDRYDILAVVLDERIIYLPDANDANL